MLRGSRAQQLTGKRKGKVQEDEEITKVSRVDRLHKRNIGLLIIAFFFLFLVFVYLMETHVFCFLCFGDSWASVLGLAGVRYVKLKKYFEHVKCISSVASQFQFLQFQTKSFIDAPTGQTFLAEGSSVIYPVAML